MRRSSAPPRVSSGPAPAAGPPSLIPGENAGEEPAGRVGERYLVQQELGRGGMAVVYRVLDVSSGAHMALKQLLLADHGRNRDTLQSLFEHEYRTLAELDHPRVIHVEDYGVAASGPYYTMELLDGGNLTQRAPVPWREACALIHDVCSSLALLHSRRLLHRDVSPHNVRCTVGGRAKLIDFGAMVQMGPCSQPVGTPAFVAPEVAQRGTLDARTDLFSLGATLYFALTGRPAYPARSFEQLLEQWSKRPAPPSAYAADVPARLDVLVMGLLSLDPALRPRSAFEVMSQLAACADLEEREAIEVSRVYLAAPLLLGREELLAKVQRRTTRARVRRGNGLLIDGAPGAGRSRALAAAVLQAKIAGLTVVHASARRAGREPFALVTQILQQLVRMAPQASAAAISRATGTELLFEPLESDKSVTTAAPALKVLSNDPKLRAAQQQALTSFCAQLSRRNTLAFAIDDLDDADEPSSAWLAGLVEQAKQQRLLLIYTARSASVSSREKPALNVIAERCTRVTLQPFTPAQLERLCDSIFGNVPYVRLCADRVYRIAVGNPRASMDLLRHLVEQKRIRYEGGNWILPEFLDADALPASMDESYAERVSRLSSAARWLAQAHALSRFAALTSADHAQLMGSSAASDSARSELLQAAVLAGQSEFTIADDAWTRALLIRLSETERSKIHLKLAELGAGRLRFPTGVAYHYQCAGEPERALEMLMALPPEEDPLRTLMLVQLSAAQISSVLEQGLSTVLTLGRGELAANELRRLCCGVSIATQGDEYERLSPAWLAALRRDAGLDDWDARAHMTDAGQRLTHALTQASERYNAAPEAVRGYRPEIAIRHLINYVVISIAISGRTFDAARLRSLPLLLAPFVGLSPIIAAIHQNAVATYEYIGEGRIKRARERWRSVLESLREVQGDSLQYVGPIRGAIAYGLGLIEILRGYSTATNWANMLDGDDLQRVNAMYLRRVARLQLGDVEGAERFRQKAEMLAVAANSRQMFDSMLVPELIVYGLAADLTGLQHVVERLQPVAARYPAWICYERLGRAQLALLHGSHDEALEHTAVALSRCTPDESKPERCYNAWPWVVSARCHALLAAGRPQEAKDLAAEVLAGCMERGMDATEELVRALSLAEARLGDFAQGSQRLDELLAQQVAAGIVGINLGATHEARTRIAIWAGDREAIEKHGQLTAEAYAHGQGSPLGARYERLMSEARSRGVSVQPALTQFETSMFGTTSIAKTVPNAAMASLTLRTASTQEERLGRALRLICDATGARAGQLHLIADNGLRVAAVLGDPQQTDAYGDLAQQCLDSALDEDVGATQMLSDAASVAASTSEDLSVLHQPMLQRAIVLTGERDEKPYHAAVVVLDGSARAATTREQHELLAVIASFLLTAGDTPGVLANG
jgi:hypothetical protein